MSGVKNRESEALSPRRAECGSGVSALRESPPTKRPRPVSPHCPPEMWLQRSWGGHLPRQCVTERRSLKTKPLNLVKLSMGVTAQDRIQIIHQTLHHLRRIYSMNLSSVTWVQATVEHFRLLLDRQFRELEVCVRKPSTGSRARKNATVHKYFRKLRKFLKLKGFSDCAWEITRAETRAHLQQLLLIMATISKEY